MLFVGRAHLETFPTDLYRRIKHLAKFGVFGPFHEFAADVATDVSDDDNLAIYEYLKRQKVGFTFLNSVTRDITQEEADRYAQLFTIGTLFNRETGYKEYIEEFLRQKRKDGTTVTSSPKAAAELVRRLKEQRGEPESKSAGDGGRGNRPEKEQTKERPHWFSMSHDELQTKLHRDTLWSEKGIDARGHDYEQLRRANLGSNCPVIDDIVIDAMTATSMKTLDLALKSYQDIREVDSKVREYIDKLSGFNEGRWKGDRFIRGRDFQDRYLELGIPAGKATQTQIDKLVELQDYAQSKDVTLVICEVP